MNSKQEALVKMAQLRGAINHVLRMRAMQKQAGETELKPEPVANAMYNTGQFLMSDVPPAVETLRKNFWKYMPSSLKDMTYRGVHDSDMPRRYVNEADLGRAVQGLTSPNPLEKAHVGLDLITNLSDAVGGPLFRFGAQNSYK